MRNKAHDQNLHSRLWRRPSTQVSNICWAKQRTFSSWNIFPRERNLQLLGSALKKSLPKSLYNLLICFWGGKLFCLIPPFIRRTCCVKIVELIQLESVAKGNSKSSRIGLPQQQYELHTQIWTGVQLICDLQWESKQQAQGKNIKRSCSLCDTWVSQSNALEAFKLFFGVWIVSSSCMIANECWNNSLDSSLILFVSEMAIISELWLEINQCQFPSFSNDDTQL